MEIQKTLRKTSRSKRDTVPDPDPEIEGEGGGGGGGGGSSRPLEKGETQSPPIFFSASWVSVWSKTKGGGADPPGPSPGSATEITNRNLKPHVTTTPGLEPVANSHLSASPICMGSHTSRDWQF